MSKLTSFENSEIMVKSGYITRAIQEKMILNGEVSTPPKMHYAPTEIKKAWEVFESVVNENKTTWEDNLPLGQTIGKVTINISK